MSTTYQEENLPSAAKEFHRVIASAIEELEAVDWYHQRAAVTGDSEAKAIFEHNRDEEIEHFAMSLEWLRRNHEPFDEALKAFLFSKGEITSAEAAFTSGEGSGSAIGALSIGSLKK
ncbi:MAG: ferritin [Helicobacteraceae bacterium]|nr:ferritin [Helicobacteraceae bacterium]